VIILTDDEAGVELRHELQYGRLDSVFSQASRSAGRLTVQPNGVMQPLRHPY